MSGPGELKPAANSVQETTPGAVGGPVAASFVATDLDARRMLREARGCLDDVIADIQALALVIENYKAWLAVPEFLRGERDRVWWQGGPFDPD